jgi:NADPH2:quinone reductase
LGAAGGVGLTAVEIGKAMGARVIAAASSDDRLAAARAHGADELVNYASADLKAQVEALTDGKGVEVCFDPVGGPLFDAALSSLAWGGRILLVGFVGGIPQIPANRLLVKHRSALGSLLRYFRAYAPDKLQRSKAELLAWYGEGRPKPLISASYPLQRAVEALKSLTERRAIGKVVIRVDGARGVGPPSLRHRVMLLEVARSPTRSLSQQASPAFGASLDRLTRAWYPGPSSPRSPPSGQRCPRA